MGKRQRGGLQNPGGCDVREGRGACGAGESSPHAGRPGSVWFRPHVFSAEKKQAPSRRLLARRARSQTKTSRSWCVCESKRSIIFREQSGENKRLFFFFLISGPQFWLLTVVSVVQK